MTTYKEPTICLTKNLQPLNIYYLPINCQPLMNNLFMNNLPTIYLLNVSLSYNPLTLLISLPFISPPKRTFGEFVCMTHRLIGIYLCLYRHWSPVGRELRKDRGSPWLYSYQSILVCSVIKLPQKLKSYQAKPKETV